MPTIAPSIIQKCRQWSVVSIIKLSPTVPRNAAKMARIGALPGHADEGRGGKPMITVVNTNAGIADPKSSRPT